MEELGVASEGILPYCHPECQRLTHSSRRSRRVALTGFLPLSHASHACAAGRHLLRLSMCARRFAPTPTLRSAYVFLYRSFVISFLRMTSLRWVSPIHGAVCSHVSRRAAAGRYSLRLSMCARHYVPNAHASLREIPPCVAARRCASPPQNASFLPPPAAVTVLPQNDNSPPSVPGPGHL